MQKEAEAEPTHLRHQWPLEEVVEQVDVPSYQNSTPITITITIQIAITAFKFQTMGVHLFLF